jgi:transcriptional regulator GlxA family with amidase domain
MDQRVKLVAELISKDLQRDLSLAVLARQVNLSSSRLRHLFKAQTGMSPHQYLKSLRMQTAKQLIDSTFLRVKEIRLRVGVHDKNRFARDFKKTYGVTPAQCRDNSLHTKGETAKTDDE